MNYINRCVHLILIVILKRLKYIFFRFPKNVNIFVKFIMNETLLVIVTIKVYFRNIFDPIKNLKTCSVALISYVECVLKKKYKHKTKK